MIKQIFKMLALALLMAVPSQAAVARTYPDALSKAGKNPIVMFIYGANYDKVSERTYEAFVKKNKIAPFIRQAVFLEMPLYQMPNDREKKDMAKRLGNKRLPGGIYSYPCLAVVDAHENLRGVVQGPEEMKDPETALAVLKNHIDNFYKQEKLLERAAKAKGDRQSALLLEAADIDLRMPRAGHGGNTAMGQRLAFDPLSVVEKLQTLSYPEANAYIRQMMAQGGYSKLQRQMMMAAYAGHLRRGAEGQSPASKERLRALYTEMRNIDPKSTYGAYAEGALVIWVEGGSLTDQPIPTEINRVNKNDDGGSGSGSGTVTPDKSTPGKSTPGNTAMGSVVEPEEVGSVDADAEEEDDDSDFQ